MGIVLNTVIRVYLLQEIKMTRDSAFQTGFLRGMHLRIRLNFSLLPYSLVPTDISLTRLLHHPQFPRSQRRNLLHHSVFRMGSSASIVQLPF